MAVLLEQLLTEYTDPSGVRKTLEAAVTPSTQADPAYPRAYYHPRTPDVITTRGWLMEGKLIKCFCNPSAAGWSLPRRETMQKTASGVVRNTWRNRYRNSYFDSFPVTLSFQSGNILPSAAYDPAMVDAAQMVAERDNIIMPAGLHNFYMFMNLLDQPALGGSQANYHIVVYHSRIFPELWMEGWFQPEGINWRDEGNFVNWEATFLVVRTVPQLSNFDLMHGLYTDWVKGNAMNETVPQSVLEAINQKRITADAFAESIPAFAPNPTPASVKEQTPDKKDPLLDLTRQAAGLGGSTTKDPSKVAGVDDLGPEPGTSGTGGGGIPGPVGSTPAAFQGGKYNGSSEKTISKRTLDMIGGGDLPGTPENPS